MKKQYTQKLKFLLPVIGSLCLFAGCAGKLPPISTQPGASQSQTVSITLPVKEPETPSASAASAETIPTAPSETASKIITIHSIPQAPRASMENSLFIGDSRTVGLLDYAKRKNADYFADVGMTVYNIHDLVRPVPSVGRVSLKKLLQSKNYEKIFIMLGINEAGYRIEQTARYYDQLVEYIQQAQPNAEIYLQANLHVSESRSRRDTMINNPVLDQINQHIADIAEKRKVFYLNANELFDDGSGSLAENLTGDETHLYGKYYEIWADWIAWKTAVLREERGL